MNDLIERSKAVEAIYWNVMEVNSKEMAESILSDVPTVDAEPVKHGHWEVVDETEPRRWGCSNCRCLSWHEFYYCPNCGAKMDEEEENETN